MRSRESTNFSETLGIRSVLC